MLLLQWCGTASISSRTWDVEAKPISLSQSWRNEDGDLLLCSGNQHAYRVPAFYVGGDDNFHLLLSAHLR